MATTAATGTRQGPEIWLRGPVPSPDQQPPAHSPAGRRFSWVATHGGAGVSTLATVYGSHDSGRDWPGPADPPPVLLVARTHAAGLESVLRALETLRQGEAGRGLDLEAVVLVADAPVSLPSRLVEHVRLIESLVKVHHVPWVAAWRLGGLSGEPPRDTAALARLTGTRAG